MKLLLLLASVLLTSCATITPQQMKKEIQGFNLPYRPEKGESVIYVVRPSSLGALVRFNVFLDDTKSTSEMGWNRGSQFIHFFVEPGERTIFSVAENTASLKFNVTEGETVFIKQDSQMGFIMARNSISKIGELEGTYHIMKLNKGKIIKDRKAEDGHAMATQSKKN